jgi:hypothetical protein
MNYNKYSGSKILGKLEKAIAKNGPLEKWKPKQSYDFVYNMLGDRELSSDISVSGFNKLSGWARQMEENRKKNKPFMVAVYSKNIRDYLTENYLNEVHAINERNAAKASQEVTAEDILEKALTLKDTHDFDTIIHTARSIARNREVFGLSNSPEFAQALDGVVEKYDRLLKSKGSAAANSYLNTNPINHTSTINYLRKGILKCYVPQLQETYKKD